MPTIQPRGIRNHNPGNLRRSADPWQGLAPDQKDRDFFSFASPAFGIRALAVTLITYQDKHDCRSVSDFIRRWAPPNENNTRSYIAAVAGTIGVGPSVAIDIHDYATLKGMVKAIIQHENGDQPYPDSTIDEALRRAGVVKPVAAASVEAIATDPKTIAATVAGTAAAVQAAVAPVAVVWDTISGMGIDPRLLVWGASAAILGVAVWLVVAFLRRRALDAA